MLKIYRGYIIDLPKIKYFLEMIFYNKNFDISENIVLKKINDKNIRMICIDISGYIF